MNTLQLDNATFLPQVCELVKEGHTVSLRARGVSMRPFIEHDRDTAIIGYAEKFIVGDVVLAEIYKGKFVLHRIDRIDGERVILRGDGNYPGTESCRLKDLRAIMTAVERKGRTYSTEGKVWKTYSKMWVAMLPLRPYLLSVYRLFWMHQLPRRIRKLIPNKLVKIIKRK